MKNDEVRGPAIGAPCGRRCSGRSGSGSSASSPAGSDAGSWPAPGRGAWASCCMMRRGSGQVAPPRAACRLWSRGAATGQPAPSPARGKACPAGRGRRAAGRLAAQVQQCADSLLLGCLSLLQGEIVDLYIPRKWCVPAQLRTHGASARGQHGSGAAGCVGWPATQQSSSAVVISGAEMLGWCSLESRQAGELHPMNPTAPASQPRWGLASRPASALTPPLLILPRLPSMPPACLPLQLLDQQADHRQGPRQRAAQCGPPG